MDFNAFQLIETALSSELAEQGFGGAQPLEDPAGQAVIFAAEGLAYSLLYDGKRKSFLLRSTNLVDGKPKDWRTLSTWLFDQETGDRSDAESIVNDFLEVVRGPKRVEMVQQQQRKRQKGEDRSVDPMFFVNRLAGMFPDLKEPLNQEKITYGQVRYITFIKTHALPEMESLLRDYPDSDPARKLGELLDDMYKSGDLDLRAIVTYVVIDGLSAGSFETLYGLMGEELQKVAKPARKLIGRNIKPEKRKKKRGKKVEARL